MTTNAALNDERITLISGLVAMCRTKKLTWEPAVFRNGYIASTPDWSVLVNRLSETEVELQIRNAEGVAVDSFRSESIPNCDIFRIHMLEIWSLAKSSCVDSLQELTRINDQIRQMLVKP